ncbi:HAD family hydrolase [Nakamurella antarctica]|uniref:HAD family hydrolase n=1 Tax=Nakamurella antarctica TaxID=1902245 RepID=UPI0013DDF5C3|nr:HAD family phosphatase [Nakamurella antarctica]
MNSVPAETDLPHAVLWDLDGTLIDSEHHWLTVQYALTDAHNAPWTEADSLASIGRALPDSARALRESGVDMPEPHIIDHLVDTVSELLKDGVTWMDGARKMLENLAAAGIPCALVTMSYRKIAEQVAAVAPKGAFRVIISGDDVEFGKPHPEPYLRAAAALGVKPEHCVAFEDSSAGVASAEAAGAKVVVLRGITKFPWRAGRSYVNSLASLNVQDVREIARGHVVDL